MTDRSSSRPAPPPTSATPPTVRRPRPPRPQPRPRASPIVFAAFVALAVLVATFVVGLAIQRFGASSSAGPTLGPNVSFPPLLEEDELAGLFLAPPAVPIATSIGPATIRVEPGPSLELEDGRLVAGDVFLLGEQAPFTSTLPPGETRVTLLIAAFAEDERVAAVVIGDPTALGNLTWTMALGDGQATPGPDEVVAFPVESGTAGFTGTIAAERIRSDAGYSELLIEAFEASGFGAEGPVRIPIDDARTLHVLAVPSGWGDGAYVTWAGTDASGATVAFLTSFDVLDRPT